MGLTHDDYGKLFWIDNTSPLKSAQFHPKYWKTVHRLAKNLPAGDPVSLGKSYEPAFTKATSICLTGDRVVRSMQSAGLPLPVVSRFTVEINFPMIPGSLLFLRSHHSCGSAGLCGVSGWKTHASQSRTRRHGIFTIL